MRPVRASALLALTAATLMAGCEQASGPTGKAEPATAAACDDRVEECRGRAGRPATAAAFTEEEIGTSATFPVGAWVCPAFSGHAIRGYFTRVGEARFDCLDPHASAETSAYGVRSFFNAAFEPTLDAARGVEHPCRHDDRFAGRPGGRPFAIRGLDSRVCVERQPDGRILIEVEAASGRQGGDGAERDAPRAHHSAWLLTSKATWPRDRVLFGAFLDWLIVAPEDNADCFWRRGRLRATNGSPGVRLYLSNGRILGVTSPSGDEGPDLLPAEATAALASRQDPFATDVDGDWLVCALEPDRPGWMRPVRVLGARSLQVSAR